jgi:aspartate/methionine/tyrosine aminotransferase
MAGARYTACLQPLFVKFYEGVGQLTDAMLACRYGAEQGKGDLRSAICKKLYGKAGRKPSEIFVSDGSKCDIGRLQV